MESALSSLTNRNQSHDPGSDLDTQGVLTKGSVTILSDSSGKLQAEVGSAGVEIDPATTSCEEVRTAVSGAEIHTVQSLMLELGASIEEMALSAYVREVQAHSVMRKVDEECERAINWLRENPRAGMREYWEFIGGEAEAEFDGLLERARKVTGGGEERRAIELAKEKMEIGMRKAVNDWREGWMGRKQTERKKRLLQGRRERRVQQRVRDGKAKDKEEKEEDVDKG